MKDTSMKYPVSSGILGHAHRLLDSLQSFNNGYLDCQRGDSGKLQAMPAAWSRLLPVCIEAGKATSRDSGELANWIRDAGRWCKRFSDAVNSQGFSDAVFNDHCDGIMRIVQSGWQLFEQHPKKDEPFAYLQDDESRGRSGDAETSVANPLQSPSTGAPVKADPQKSASGTQADANQPLSNGEYRGKAEDNEW